jgi:hypothetical protein
MAQPAVAIQQMVDFDALAVRNAKVGADHATEFDHLVEAILLDLRGFTGGVIHSAPP